MTRNPLLDVVVLFSDTATGQATALVRMDHPELGAVIARNAAEGRQPEVIPVESACARLMRSLQLPGNGGFRGLQCGEHPV